MWKITLQTLTDTSTASVYPATDAVILAVPSPTAVTLPLYTVAAFGSDVCQRIVLSDVVSFGQYSAFRLMLCPLYRFVFPAPSSAPGSDKWAQLP